MIRALAPLGQSSLEICLLLEWGEPLDLLLGSNQGPFHGCYPKYITILSHQLGNIR